jgi:predicted HNH restriction endonuclease
MRELIIGTPNKRGGNMLNDKEIRSRRQAKKARRRWLAQYKTTLSCSMCGFSFKDRPECCDFHHTPKPASRPHALYIATSTSDEALEEELKKCTPVCANCHRTVHKR